MRTAWDSEAGQCIKEGQRWQSDPGPSRCMHGEDRRPGEFERCTVGHGPIATHEASEEEISQNNMPLRLKQQQQLSRCFARPEPAHRQSGHRRQQRRGQRRERAYGPLGVVGRAQGAPTGGSGDPPADEPHEPSAPQQLIPLPVQLPVQRLGVGEAVLAVSSGAARGPPRAGPRHDAHQRAAPVRQEEERRRQGARPQEAPRRQDIQREQAGREHRQQGQARAGGGREQAAALVGQLVVEQQENFRRVRQVAQVFEEQRGQRQVLKEQRQVLEEQWRQVLEERQGQVVEERQGQVVEE